MNADPDPATQINADPDPKPCNRENPAKNTVWEKMHESSVADPDPGSGAFLTPGSGMGRKSASGSGIFDADPGSGMEKSRIRDGKKSDPDP